MRSVTKLALAVLAALAVAGCASSHSAAKLTDPSASNSPAGTSTPLPTPTAELTSAETRFVSLFRQRMSAIGLVSDSTDAQLAHTGHSTCKLLGLESPATIIRQTGQPRTTKALIYAAEHSLCRKYLPHVLVQFSGNGQGASRPFLVDVSPLVVTYSFDCSAFGSTGNFVADLVSGNPASLDSDDQLVANALAAHGHTTTRVYPTKTGSEYHVTINSECSWSVTVKT